MPFSIEILNFQNKKNSSYEYWNEKNIEKKKFFYKILSDFESFKNDSKQNNFSYELSRIIKDNKININDKSIMSIGSGSCYVEAKTFSFYEFKNLTCLDFSKHRITELAPVVFDKFKMTSKSINLICGDPHEYFKKYEKQKFDLIFMCAAFHHFEKPENLLNLLINKLNVNGYIIIIGEPYINFFEKIKYLNKNLLKYILNYKKFRSYFTFDELISGLISKDKTKGDNIRSIRSYKNLFKKFNFKIKSIDLLSLNKNHSSYQKDKTISFCIKN